MRLKVILASTAAVAFLACTTFAKKPSNAGNQVPEYFGGAVSYSDNVGDAITSDLSGDYVDGVDGTELVHAQPSAVMYGRTGPTRSVYISLGDCLDGPCEDPFGGSLAGLTDGEVGFVQASWYDWDRETSRWPGIGETLISATHNSGPSVTGGGYNLLFRVNGQAYRLEIRGANGDISATGFDDDNDSFLDRVEMTVGAGAELTLVKYVTTTTIRGKKETTSTSTEILGRFTNMAHTVTFRSFNYLRPLPATGY